MQRYSVTQFTAKAVIKPVTATIGSAQQITLATALRLFAAAQFALGAGDFPFFCHLAVDKVYN